MILSTNKEFFILIMPVTVLDTTLPFSFKYLLFIKKPIEATNKGIMEKMKLDTAFLVNVLVMRSKTNIRIQIS
jgi:hypothetical protein